jgi:hypothetical protein
LAPYDTGKDRGAGEGEGEDGIRVAEGGGDQVEGKQRSWRVGANRGRAGRDAGSRCVTLAGAGDGSGERP